MQILIQVSLPSSAYFTKAPKRTPQGYIHQYLQIFKITVILHPDSCRSHLFIHVPTSHIVFSKRKQNLWTYKNQTLLLRAVCSSLWFLRIMICSSMYPHRGGLSLQSPRKDADWMCRHQKETFHIPPRPKVCQTTEQTPTTVTAHRWKVIPEAIFSTYCTQCGSFGERENNFRFADIER